MKRLRARRLDTGLAIRDLLPQRDWRVTFRQKQARPRPETRRLLGTKTERHRCRQPPHARTSPEGAVGAPTNASPPAMLARLPAIMSTLDSLSRAGLPSIHPRSLEPCRKTHRPSSITPCGNSAQKTTTACTQGRCPDRRSISSLRLAAAASLKEEIERRSGQRTWVRAVVVFWAEFPQGVIDDGRCVFLHGSKLRGWMEGRPARLSESSVDMIAGSLASIAGGEAFVGAPTAPSGLVRA